MEKRRCHDSGTGSPASANTAVTGEAAIAAPSVAPASGSESRIHAGFDWMTIMETAAVLLLFGEVLRSLWLNVSAVFQSSDTAWLVKAGEFILRHGFLPAHDPFSWTRAGDDWVMYQWLFELAAGFLYQHGGLWLVGLGASILAATVLFAILPAQMFKENVRAPYVFGFLALAVYPAWFWARPQLFSFLFIPLFISVLEDFRCRGYNKRMWCLPPVMMLWSNLHSFWFTGLLITCLYLIPPAVGARSSGLRIRSRLLLLASCLAVLANPYGWRIIGYNLSFLTQPDFAGIYELHPLLLSGAAENLNCLLYFLLAAFGITLWRAHIPPQGLILACLGVTSGLLFYRFFPVAVLLTWPYLAMALGRFDLTSSRPQVESESGSTDAGGNLQRIKSPGVMSPRGVARLLPYVAMFSVPCIYCLQFPLNQTTWFTYSHNNLQVIQFLKQHPQYRKQIYSDAAIGCSSILEDIGPVFIDTRFDFYGKKFYDAWLNCLRAGRDWQGYLNGWGITTAAISTQYPLYLQLKNSTDWNCVFDDGQNAVFVIRH